MLGPAAALTITAVQQTEKCVQKVSDDSSELLCRRVLYQLSRVVGLRQVFPCGSQRHAQPLDSVMRQVELQLELNAVLVGRENTGILLDCFIRLAQEVLCVISTV